MIPKSGLVWVLPLYSSQMTVVPKFSSVSQQSLVNMLMGTPVHWFKVIYRSLKRHVTLEGASVLLHPPKREQSEVNVHQTTQYPTVTGVQTDSNKDNHKYSPTLQNKRPLQGKHCSLRHLQDSPAPPLKVKTPTTQAYTESLTWWQERKTSFSRPEFLKGCLWGCIYSMCDVKLMHGADSWWAWVCEWMTCFPGTNSG